ncbi:MAG: phosphatase PAP2 family protein [Verrucomicrobiaceae bacterium]|nr:phosphatase PAP2 family protein [Verrucomicrobiaceae bacterium]
MKLMNRRIQIHEGFYLALGGAVSVALLVFGSWKPASLIVAALIAAYALVLQKTARGSVTRVLAAYVVTWAFYMGSSVIVDWLPSSLRQYTLHQIDALLFNRLVAKMVEGAFTSWQNDLLSAGYMSYHVYLHWVLIDSLRRGSMWREALGERLFLAFGFGFVGYLFFPAAPPLTAFPGLQPDAIAGGFLTRANEWLNAHMAARYDAFPSLHALVTATLLSWDWRHARWRFRIMLLPSLLMLAATLALRLHYVADLLASAALFLILSLLHANRLIDRRASLGA